MKLARLTGTMLTALLCFALSVAAQAPPQPDPVAQAKEIKKLDFIVGEWAGEGWMILPGGVRETFTSWEKVQSKLEGVALLVEGLHKSRADGKVVHQTLAVISYDEAAKNFRFKTNLANGRAGDYTGKVVADNVFEWGMDVPRGKIRYTIKLSDKGEWFEVGEYSPDGTTWRKIFEMTLKKVK